MANFLYLSVSLTILLYTVIFTELRDIIMSLNDDGVYVFGQSYEFVVLLILFSIGINLFKNLYGILFTEKASRRLLEQFKSDFRVLFPKDEEDKSELREKTVSLVQVLSFPVGLTTFLYYLVLIASQTLGYSIPDSFFEVFISSVFGFFFASSVIIFIQKL